MWDLKGNYEEKKDGVKKISDGIERLLGKLGEKLMKYIIGRKF